MLRAIRLLCLAATLGVVGATAVTCGVGLASGTGTWCGLPLYWIGGIPPAIFFALVFGVPAEFIFRKLGLRQWWQFTLGGIIFAIPFWHSFAQPFDSPRWLQSGFFDSLNYLGSGAVAGFAYWFLSRNQVEENAP